MKKLVVLSLIGIMLLGLSGLAFAKAFSTRHRNIQKIETRPVAYSSHYRDIPKLDSDDSHYRDIPKYSGDADDPDTDIGTSPSVIMLQYLIDNPDTDDDSDDAISSVVEAMKKTQSEFQRKLGSQ
jgi:hypothetical protein